MMPHFRMLVLVLPGFLTASLAIAAQQSPCPSGNPQWLLQPNDPAYGEAQTFARFLSDHRIEVRCITGTTIGSDLLGEPRSAGFHTDVGSFSVVFFPAPDGAERITTTLKVKGGHYCYSFRTRQPGLLSHQEIDVEAPMYLLVRGSWFIIITDPRAQEPIRLALRPGVVCPAVPARAADRNRDVGP